VAAGLDRLMMWARRQVPSQMSSTAIATLDTLVYRGPIRISELAERERLTQPGMTTLVNRLAEQGLAERVADATDGRATLVRITNAGRDLLIERHANRTQALLTHVERLQPAHRRALVAALDAIEELVASTANGTP
jgi:DNA-binding MarR family transcriptional regulator